MNQNRALGLIAIVSVASIASAAQESSADRSTQIASRQAHYAAVEQELAQRCDAAVSDEQRAARARMLEVLEAYRVRADFGCNYDLNGSREPQFVDSDGRRCAVAELLHATGRDDLVTAVASSDNLAWVLDLAGNAPFRDWLDANGLSLEEAARIQAPATHIAIRPPPPVYDGPSDGGSSSGASGGATRSTGARVSSGSISRSGDVPTTAGGPSVAAILEFTESADAWWMWWENNKAEFLRPNRLGLDGPRSDDVEHTFSSQLASVRRMLEPSIVRALASSDAQVRAAAAIALGRTAGAAAVEHLLPLLDDAQLVVREHALLGLGATGSAVAQKALLAIAHDGRLDKSSTELGLPERAHAIVALGLGRRAGFEASVDAEIAQIVATRRLPQRETLGVAAMMYATLSPSPELGALALQLARSESEPTNVRCRAIEALRSARDAATLSVLQHLLSGARVELRRSAALALGEYDHALVVPALQTAYELENEPLTRGFLLISIGRHGGDAARDFVVRVLDNDKGSMRPWAVLSLGLMARSQGDQVAARAIRDAVAKEKNAQSRPAYWLAAGLARDVEAAPALTDALMKSADALERSYAALGLAMIGNDACHDALVSQLLLDKSALTRSQISVGLGVLGAPGDAERLRPVLAGVSDPELQVQVTGAIAFHGSAEAMHELGSLSLDAKLGATTRAAVLDGLGMLMSTGESLALLELSRSVNFVQFDETQRALLQTTL
jgi:HEAT repeat protein